MGRVAGENPSTNRPVSYPLRTVPPPAPAFAPVARGLESASATAVHPKMPAKTEWTKPELPPWVPVWIPSVEAIKTAGKASIGNVKDNILREGKSKPEAAAELALLLAQYGSFLFLLIGLGPGIPPWYLPQLVGIALMVVGAFFFLTAAATLSTQLSLLATPSPDGIEIVSTGVFKYCRHPQYFGMIAFGIGFSLATCSTSRLTYTVIMWLALEKKADLEEFFLSQQYPDAYPKYAEGLPKFIPGVLPSDTIGFNKMDDEEGKYDPDHQGIAE